MHASSYLLLPLGLIASATQASELSNSYNRLKEGILQQIELLESVSDADSAQRIIAPYKEASIALSLLKNEGLDTTDFLKYILNSKNRNDEIIRLIRRQTLVLQELAAVKCYDNEQLYEMLFSLMAKELKDDSSAKSS